MTQVGTIVWLNLHGQQRRACITHVHENQVVDLSVFEFDASGNYHFHTLEQGFCGATQARGPEDHGQHGMWWYR